MMDLAGYGPQLLQGAALTLELAFTSLAVGLSFGLLAAAAKLSPLPWLSVPVTIITNLLRGIPEFVILLICYFGVTRLLWSLTGGVVQISPFAGAVFALGVVFAAYSSEMLRGAFLAVPRGQLEAARAFGMSPRLAFFRVHLPQAWRLALPSLNNQWQNLLKDTSLVSVLGLEELMRKASIGAQVTRQPFTFFLAAALIYLVFLGVSNPVFALLERRARRGMARP
ncbi:MAG TPA: ABC transporter permease subunit [Acetobacteraceae bacterium]|nr:ABC transporter permease subunit [Acetobacteraceae bacterium]